MKSKLLIDGQHALYSPTLAVKIGRSAATILQQAHYWMSVKGGKTIDGIKWFWKTYEQWAEELSLSISTARRAIAKLKSLGLLEIEKLSAKTHYQANWYTIRTEGIKSFLGEQMDLFKTDTSICSKWADHIKDSSSKNFSPQDAAEEKNFEGEGEEEIDWETIAKKIETWEQQQQSAPTQEAEPPQKPRYADKIGQTDSHKRTDPNEDQSPAPQNEVISSSDKPSNQQIAEVCNELRRLRINADECMGVIKKYWKNVPGAIARVKEGLDKGWCDNPIGLFNSSCKNGAKPENTITQEVKEWYEWACKKRIVAAMMGGTTIITHDNEFVPLDEMMRRFPRPSD